MATVEDFQGLNLAHIGLLPGIHLPLPIGLEARANKTRNIEINVLGF